MVSSTAAGAADLRTVIDWLAAIGDRRDLEIAPPDNSYTKAIEFLLDCLSGEFLEYRDVVTNAREAARKNADQLRTIIRSSLEQGSLVRATSQAAAGAEQGAVEMAAAAEALRGFATAAAAAAADAGGNLAAIDAALTELGQRLAQGDAPLADMRRSTAGVADFLLTLARLSRHAQLLAVNASIEAAHLAEAGARFAIVAEEVRNLSVSTRESKADVSHIVAELRDSTGQIAAATGESKTATSAAGNEIGGAASALARTAEGIAEFEQLVATVADVTGTQSMALAAINTSIDQIAHHAEEATSASRGAGGLNLDALLERAQAQAGRWKTRSPQRADFAPGDDFGRWIHALGAGTDPKALADVDKDGALQPLVTAVRSLLERVNAEQREILGGVVQVAVAVARNGYAWQSILQSLRGVRGEIALVRETIGETAAGVRASVELAGNMRRLVDSISQQYNAALTLLDDALARIARISTSVTSINELVASMSSAAARVDQIMALIDTLSSETDLLSLNAAIEAAHAGNLGLGFSVIAEEIRSLARSTNDSTSSVSQMVSNIARISTELRATVDDAAASMDSVVQRAQGARTAIAALRTAVESAIERAGDVEKTSAEQAVALERVLDDINRSDAAVDADELMASDRSRVQLAAVGSRAHSIAARRPIGTVIERVRGLAESLCDRLEQTLEAALAGGKITTDRLFTFTYREIAGDEIKTLARLFDVSQVPPRGFTPAKYATPWDGAVDEAMLDVLTKGWEEASAAAFSPVTIFVSDLNGLFYAYPRQKIAAWTNDPARDNGGNRIKRLFEDDYALRVGRWGLGPKVAGLGPRTTYDQFRAAGCTLARTDRRPWGGYVYARDTSLVCNEVVMAIYVRNMRHSTLRICYDPNLI